jgi:hypothetical protein
MSNFLFKKNTCGVRAIHHRPFTQSKKRSDYVSMEIPFTPNKEL